MSTRFRVWSVPALAALGLADAAYLAVTHWIGELPACGGYSGCATVDGSPYAGLFGVPVAAYGAAFFATVLGIGLWRAWSEDASSATALPLYVLTLAGSLFMAYLTGVELFVLGAVCFWCLGAALATFLLFGLAARELQGRQPQVRLVHSRRT